MCLFSHVGTLHEGIQNSGSVANRNVMLSTLKNIGEALEDKRVHDLWNLDGPVESEEYWTGRTTFYLMKPQPPPGYKDIEG